MTDVLDTPLDQLDLSTRSINCFKNEGLITIGDVIKLSEAELLRFPNFGRKGLIEVNEILSSFGVNLRDGGRPQRRWVSFYVDSDTYDRFAQRARYGKREVQAEMAEALANVVKDDPDPTNVSSGWQNWKGKSSDLQIEEELAL